MHSGGSLLTITCVKIPWISERKMFEIEGLMFDPRTILKYVAIQLAQLLALAGALGILGSVIPLPGLVIGVVLALWVLKDIVLYRWVWRAYAYLDPDPLSDFVGMEVTAVGLLDPEGFVRVHGELWKARLVAPVDDASGEKRLTLERGERARVVGVRRRMLLVERSLFD